MSCNRVPLFLVICCILMSFAGVTSQSTGRALSPDWRQCSNWTPLAGDKKGTIRRIFIYGIQYDSPPLPVESVADDKLTSIRGIFKPQDRVYVGIVSEPNDYAPTSQF